ncbi:copper resistance protein CopC [Barrientosiimonas marina]|uniref:Copper resistance protein CopC n=1 Tax=Lentibacillus kimchii TaxID=1542911 RepID=A0ABW2UUG4_9BACI
MTDRVDLRRLYAKKSHLANLIVLFMAFFILLSYTPAAEAHATLVEMEPAEDVVADKPPSELMLRFNEPVEHDLAMVNVYDVNAQPVFTGNPDNEEEKSPKLTFSLPELDNGTYTVNWDAVSADGHPVSGTYAFSVGEATESGVNTVDESNGTEGTLIASRIIPEVLILLGAGLFWFAWLAERKGFPGIDVLWSKRRYIGATLLFLGTMAELVTYSLSLPPGIIQVILNGRWELLGQFPFILMLFAQLLFLILLVIPGMERGWYLALWLLLAVTLAFGGHVWGMKDPIIALIPRIFHLLAMALWLGALAYVMLLVISEKRQKTSVDWQAFRPFFVYKMIAASALVVISGVVMVYLQTGITAVFTDWKTWSGVVIAKVLLTMVMGGLALYQTLKWRKRQTFTTRRLVRTEWLVGLAVMILGVWLSQIAYPISVETYDETLVTDNQEAEIHIDELQTGDRTMTASIPELDGEQPESVEAKVTMPQHDMGSDDIKAEENDEGNYTAELPFSMSGTWHLEMTATYSDHEKVKWEDDVYMAGQGD